MPEGSVLSGAHVPPGHPRDRPPSLGRVREMAVAASSRHVGVGVAGGTWATPDVPLVCVLNRLGGRVPFGGRLVPRSPGSSNVVFGSQCGGDQQVSSAPGTATMQS